MLEGITAQSLVVPAGLSVLSAGLTLLVTLWFKGRDHATAKEEKTADERDVMRGRITELETALKVMKESITPISLAFQQILIKELTHFHEPRTDELLRKVGPPYVLSEVEENELAVALTKRLAEAGPLMTDREKGAAIMLPYVIKRVKAEFVLGIPPQAEAEIKLVAVPSLAPPK